MKMDEIEKKIIREIKRKGRIEKNDIEREVGMYK